MEMKNAAEKREKGAVLCGMAARLLVFGARAGDGIACKDKAGVSGYTLTAWKREGNRLAGEGGAVQAV
jgi:hypothetical protein